MRSKGVKFNRRELTQAATYKSSSSNNNPMGIAAEGFRQDNGMRSPLLESKHADAANVSRTRKTSALDRQGRRHQSRQNAPRQQPGYGRQQLMILLSLIGQVALVVLLAAVRIYVSEAFFIDERQSPQTSEWNYNEQIRWRQMHRECSGRAQSPIDIRHKNVIISQHLRLHFYNYDHQIKFKLSNAHHTVKMNPIGSAYDQDLEHHAVQRSGLNSSSIHDIMTADEYLEILPTSNQGTSSGVGGGSLVGGTDNDHLSRLISTNPIQRGDKQQLQPGAAARRPTDVQKANRDQNLNHHHQSDAIEHERELEHGQTGGFGSALLGQQSNRERTAYDGAPTIKLDWLDDGNNEYKLRDIHFHWGERRDNGSEHAIDGRRAAMEMHLVHIKHGLGKSSIGFTSDSVAVIAILIESHRKSNLDFNPIVNELARINATEQAQEVDYKSLYDLLPNNLQAFYTYSGSLTTPPCYQVVNWIVMAERLNMNAKQIEMFRNLYAPPKRHRDEMASPADEMSDHYDQHDQNGAGSHNELTTSLELIMPNVRMLQSLNNRTILASFTKHGSRLESVTSSLNSATTMYLSNQIERQIPILLGALGIQLLLWRNRFRQLTL